MQSLQDATRPWFTLACLGLLTLAILGPLTDGVSVSRTLVAVPSGTTFQAKDEPAVVPPTGPSLGRSPPYLQNLAMADDPSEGYVLAFGGRGSNLDAVDYTLAYVHGVWTNLTPDLSLSPPARWGASLVYDPQSREMVMFGGCQVVGCYPALGDTWTFYGGQWHDNSSSVGTAPSPRGFAAVAWDGADHMVLLFGGQAGRSGATVYLSDTWSFSSNHWTNLTASLLSASPGPRTAASMGSLNSSGPVLFGGHSSSVYYGDTWSFQGLNWTNLTASAGAGPSARDGSGFCGDPTAGEFVLFGGVSSTGGYLDDTWILRDGTWSREAIAGPPGTVAAGMAFDSEDGYDLMYGGSVLQYGVIGTTNAFWSYHAGAWNLWNPAPRPAVSWFLLVIPVVFVLSGTQFYVMGRQRKRRDAALNALMPTIPAQTRWVLTSPASLSRQLSRQMTMVLYGILVPVAGILTYINLQTTSGPPSTNSIGFLIGIPVLMLGLPILPILATRGIETQSVGVSDAGVIVRRPRGDLRVPWNYLQPPQVQPAGPWVNFGFVYPVQPSSAGGFRATYEQARAILSHPGAAAWTVPPPLQAPLGLSGEISPTDTSPPLSSAPRPPP